MIHTGYIVTSHLFSASVRETGYRHITDFQHLGTGWVIIQIENISKIGTFRVKKMTGLFLVNASIISMKMKDLIFPLIYFTANLIVPLVPLTSYQSSHPASHPTHLRNNLSQVSVGGWLDKWKLKLKLASRGGAGPWLS